MTNSGSQSLLHVFAILQPSWGNNVIPPVALWLALQSLSLCYKIECAVLFPIALRFNVC